MITTRMVIIVINYFKTKGLAGPVTNKKLLATLKRKK